MQAKILNSGIFKPDKNGKPTDLLRWIPSQNSFSKHGTGVGLKSVTGLIGDLSYQLEQLQTLPDIEELPFQLSSVHKLSLIAHLRDSGFSHEELEPHFSRLTNKMKNIIKKRLRAGYYQGLTGPKRKALSRLLIQGWYWRRMLIPGTGSSRVGRSFASARPTTFM